MFAIKRSPETAATRAAATETRRFGKQLVSLLLLLILLLALAGYAYLSHQQAAARAEAHQELSAIADLKLRQILHWHDERLADARFFARARFVAQDTERFLQDPASAAARSNVLHWLSLLKSDDRYYSVVLFDPQFQPRLALPAWAAPADASVRPLLQKALATHEVAFSELHRNPPGSPAHIDLAFPIFEGAEPQHGAPLAVVLLELDAQHFLFPLLQRWPTPSRSAETLLVRRDGDDVLYLNDVRHRAGSALTLRVPLATPELPAAKVLRGDTNVVEGIDYRGVPVVAAGRTVPGTAWGMVAKVDRQELYAPLRRQMVAAGLVLGLLLLVGALLVCLLWRQRSALFLERELTQRTAHEQEMERLNRLYAALSQVNQAVVRARSRQELLGEMCRVLVQFGGFHMAWLGWVDPATCRVVPLAQCGGDGYLQQVEVFADERPEGRGPVGTAIRQGRPCVCNNFLANAQMAPWHGAARRSGWQSVAAFPIRQEGKVHGALAVYARQAHFFGPQEQALLEEAAADISFGLETLHNEQRRERAEAQLRLQAAALQSAANAIVITDPHGVIQWVNAAFERLTGYSAAEALGQTPRLLKSGRQAPGFYQGMWQAIQSGQVWHGELLNKRKDGSLYTEEMTITPVRDAQGMATHFIAIKQDVTERKQAEEALRQARDQLAEVNAELERKVSERTAQLVEVNASLEAFVHTAAHDLRSPLRSIKSFSSIVLEDYAPALASDAKSLLERVTASAQQMSQLLEDLLEYSKLTQAELKLGPVSLKAAVSEVLTLLEGDIRAKNAVVTPVEPLPEVLGHSATVVMLINNLVSNALKFMPPDLQPRIRLWAEPSTLNHQPSTIIYVEDNGIGIAQKDQEKIFGAFQRLHGKGAYPGTGLGLAIVRKGAERMGGRVGVESEPGKGSRFWLELRQVSPATP